MPKATTAFAMISLLLGGCTSTLRPVSYPTAADHTGQDTQSCPVASGKASDVAGPASKERLEWMICELHAHAVANLAQAERWDNRTEWRDLPLIGAAATIAGLLLFGKRDENNALKPGVQDAVSGIGFGAAALATFANYLSPQKARDVLRQGARGHFCLATQGELLLTVWGTLDRSAIRAQLGRDLNLLTEKLAATPGAFGNVDAARSIQAQAIKAFALYDLQIQERDTAGLVIGETSWNFGIDLLTRTDRGEQNVEALVTSITAQAQSASKFSAVGASATDPAAPAAVRALVASGPRAAPTPDDLSNAVAAETGALIAGLPNVEALVLGFDKCAATALAGGTAKAERVQRVSLQ